MTHVLLLLLAPVLLTAAPPLPIEWETTPAAFAGRKAIVKLDTGARIEGVWLGVTPTTFMIDVDRAHGKNRPPKGVQTIERSAIVELRVLERRIRGQVIGGIAGCWFGGPLAFKASSAAWILPVWASVTAAGILVGRVSDKAARVVHIKPESPQGLWRRDGAPAELHALPEPAATEANEGEPES